MADAAPPIAPDVTRLGVITPSWVGDTVMATPVLRAVRHARPAATITVVCRPGLDELLAGSPWIDELAAADMKRLGGAVRAARLLRAAGAEAVLLLPNTLRSAVVATLSGARVRVGYRRAGRGPLLSHALAPPPRRRPVAACAYYATLACHALGLDEIETRMQLFLTDTQRAAAGRLLEGVPRPFVALCPGANRQAKRWPAARFAAVADELSRRGFAAVVTGAPAERKVCAAVASAAASPVADLAARGVTLGGLKGLLAEARLLVTNDTGPRHVAAALGTPVVALFGPTDPRWTTIDGAREAVLAAEPFLPAELVADDHPAACRIDRITTGDVIAAAVRLLGDPPPAPAATPGASPAATPPARPANP